MGCDGAKGGGCAEFHAGTRIRIKTGDAWKVKSDQTESTCRQFPALKITRILADRVELPLHESNLQVERRSQP